MKNIYSIILFFLVSSFLIPTFGQSDKADTLVVEKRTIPVNEISDETERLNERFSQIVQLIEKNDKIHTIDSSLNSINSLMLEEKEIVLQDSIYTSYRKIGSETRRWKVLKEKISGYKNIVKDRSDELQDVSDELYDYLSLWDNTKEEAKSRELNEDVISSIDNIRTTIKEMIEKETFRADSVFLVQQRIAEIIIEIDDVMNQLRIKENELRLGYFVIDSPPIWEAKDSTLEGTYIRSQYKIGIEDDRQILKSYIKANIPTFVFQILTLILIAISILILRKKEKGREIDSSTDRGKQFNAVLNNPISVIVILGVLITVFFYKNKPIIFREATTYILFIPTIILLPKLIDKKLRVYLIIVFVCFHLYLFQNYLPQKAFAFRIVNYANIILLLFVLIRSWFSSILKNPSANKWNRLFRIVIPFYILLGSTALVANTIGSVNLSLLITNGLISSISLGLIVLLFFIVLINISLMLLQLKVEKSAGSIHVFGDLVYNRIRPFLGWLGFVVWIVFTLKGFDIYDSLIVWFEGVFNLKWELGSIKISIGGILLFFIILIVTIFTSNVIGNVLKDDWVIHTLPKGSSSGISMVLRIIVVSLGFYLALSSVGIDLGKLGFIVGALGVGIGFGLQNVVLNFIAGLILAFERPIIVGDVIMADMEMGVVSEIGVRASKLKLYDGSEVIIPNGDLISKKVTNYTLSDYKRRSKVIVKTSVLADPNEVIEILTNVAISHEKTLEDPLPKTYFKGYGDSSLDFNLLYWTQFDDKFSTESAIVIEIYNILKEKGIHLPIPKISIENSDENPDE